ncbi:MAG: M23 family metallopeptidase [Pseudoxanthomonas suwonensis]|nr:M23 family metallopeptidase [Pseudoxanthomonas suwonensis]
MSRARMLRTILVRTLLLLALLVAVTWGWRLPAVQAMRLMWELQRMPAPDALPVPVDGIRANAIADTWGAARGAGRSHEGVDIFASRGTVVRSATRGVVLSVREGGLGGRQVWVLGPGGERHYYAHLDDWAPGLQRMDMLQPGSLLGVVGDTGNARGTPPHLHYGIYREDGAYNPWPLLQEGAALRLPPLASDGHRPQAGADSRSDRAP